VKLGPAVRVIVLGLVARGCRPQTKTKGAGAVHRVSNAGSQGALCDDAFPIRAQVDERPGNRRADPRQHHSIHAWRGREALARTTVSPSGLAHDVLRGTRTV
jgi:hypothetical protein